MFDSILTLPEFYFRNVARKKSNVQEFLQQYYVLRESIEDYIKLNDFLKDYRIFARFVCFFSRQLVNGKTPDEPLNEFFRTYLLVSSCSFFFNTILVHGLETESIRPIIVVLPIPCMSHRK